MSYPDYASGEREGGKVIAEYLYQDENREPYLRVQRTEQKQFPQSHWVNGDGLTRRGHWVFGKPKGPKIPFFLPQLIAAPANEPIFICEGEKDAEAVIDLGGLTATCASEGAGKWTPDLNKWFAGKQKVFILEDNDDAGRAHARLVARNLIGIVGEVRIVSFPELKEGGDVSDFIAAHGPNAKQMLLERARAAPIVTNVLPTIKVVEGKIAHAVDATQEAILAAGRPVFVRAGRLVEPIWSEYPAANKRKTKVTVFRPWSPAGTGYMLNKHAAIFEKCDNKGAWHTKNPPHEVVGTLLSLGHWKFPQVAGIINAPTLRPDGSILNQLGYDADTRLWAQWDETLTLPPIPEHPTREQAEAALALYQDLLAEFPFVSELDHAVAVAAIMSACLRGAADFAPLFLVVAHTAGTGKSYLVDLISTIVRGRPCPVITATKSEEEMEKRLGALLLESAPIISLDNLSEDLGSDLLCQICSQRIVKVRILGKSETPDCEWRGMLFATGNNVRLLGDLTRRGLLCNLDARVERPSCARLQAIPSSACWKIVVPISRLPSRLPARLRAQKLPARQSPDFKNGPPRFANP
jgi:putative DNA primase/helicase